MTEITGRSVYLDANVLIYAVEDPAGYGQRLRGIFERIDRGTLRGVTSELSLAEVLVKPLRNGATQVVSEFQQLLHPAGPLVMAPVTRSVLLEAAKLRALYPSVRLPDAIHAATSHAHPCDTFLTNDARFSTIGGLPVMQLSSLA